MIEPGFVTMQLKDITQSEMINFDVPDLLVAFVVAVLVAAQFNAYRRLSCSEKPVKRPTCDTNVSQRVCRVVKRKSEPYGFTLATVNVEAIASIVPGSSAEQSGVGLHLLVHYLMKLF